MRPNPCYRLEIFQAANLLARLMPRPLARVLATQVGHLAYFLARNSRRAMLDNLEQVTGKQGGELRDLCRSNFANFIRMLQDYFACTRSTPERVRALLENWRGYENLVAARERGKGTIVVTAHIGNWELGALLLALEGFPLTIVTLEEPTPQLSRWREGYRKRFGIRTITVGRDKFSFVEMIAALRRNEFVAMLVDRPSEGAGIAVPFFGRPASFSPGPAMLAAATGATVLPAFVLQKENGRYLSFAEPPVPMETGGSRDEQLARNTAQIAAAFEPVVRDHPEQWYNYLRIRT